MVRLRDPGNEVVKVPVYITSMVQRLLGETSIFGGAFFVSRLLLEINSNLKNFKFWLESLGAMLEY